MENKKKLMMPTVDEKIGMYSIILSSLETQELPKDLFMFQRFRGILKEDTEIQTYLILLYWEYYEERHIELNDFKALFPEFQKYTGKNARYPYYRRKIEKGILILKEILTELKALSPKFDKQALNKLKASNISNVKTDKNPNIHV